MDRQVISTTSVARSGFPYSQAIRFGDLIFVSGQVALVPSGQISPGGIEEQTRQVLENVRAILEAASSSLDRVLKTTCFLSSLEDLAGFNATYRTFFPTDPPARSTFQVGGLPPGMLVEIEAIAAAP